MGPAIPRIGEHSSHVGEYVIPADGRRANRKVSRNGVRGDESTRDFRWRLASSKLVDNEESLDTPNRTQHPG